MTLYSLKCPNCSGSLEIEDGIDRFYCKYCGYRIVLVGQSQEVLRTRLEFKRIEAQKEVDLKRQEYELKKMEMENKENKVDGFMLLFMGIGSFLIIAIVTLVSLFSK